MPLLTPWVGTESAKKKGWGDLADEPLLQQQGWGDKISQLGRTVKTAKLPSGKEASGFQDSGEFANLLRADLSASEGSGAGPVAPIAAPTTPAAGGGAPPMGLTTAMSARGGGGAGGGLGGAGWAGASAVQSLGTAIGQRIPPRFTPALSVLGRKAY